MTTRTQQRTTQRWVLPFLAALVAVLATILSAATASAATTGVAETRVRASGVVVEVPVGPPEHIAAGQRLGEEPARVVTVVATGVAANTVDDGAFRLIGANRAEIDPRKFTEYALNPNHPVGGNKARVFESAFGFNRSNADDLIAQLRQGVMERTPSPGVVDKFGSRFTVDIPVTGPSGSGMVRTGWIYDPGSITPRLTTAFPR
jgi:filamentous hemagglutinin